MVGIGTSFGARVRICSRNREQSGIVGLVTGSGQRGGGKRSFCTADDTEHGQRECKFEQRIEHRSSVYSESLVGPCLEKDEEEEGGGRRRIKRRTRRERSWSLL